MTKQKSSGKSAHARGPEVYDTAVRIFHQKGYAATSIQDIAAAVGLLKGSLYYYMNSKEDLLFAIIQSVHNEILELRDSAPAGPRSLDRLEMLVKAHVAYVAQNSVRVSVFLNDFRYLSTERQGLIIAERDDYEKFIADLLKQGQAEGEVDPDLDPKVAALGILGMLNWMHLWFRPGGRHSARQLGDQFAHMARNAVRPEGTVY